MVIMVDPPDHERLRLLLSRGFTPRRIARLEPRIRAIAGELLDQVDRCERFDLVPEFTVPLPVRVIAELLGIEPERMQDFKRWSEAVIAVFGRLPSPEQRARFEAVLDEIDLYFGEVIERRRREPRDDLISVLVQNEGEQALSTHEVYGFAILLLIAGNETTTNLIGGAVAALLENPDQLTKVQSDPTRVAALVEEALRFVSPVQMLFRETTCEVEIDGTKLPKGATVLPCYAAANRDPRRFPNPDRFDVDRNPIGHLAFGFGVHFCLGAGLARREARIALEALVPRLASLRLTKDAILWSDTPILRGPRGLCLARSSASRV
jgi:cytochrome P450